MQQFQEKFQFELALTTLTSAFLHFAQPDVVGGGFWYFKRTNDAVLPGIVHAVWSLLDI